MKLFFKRFAKKFLPYLLICILWAVLAYTRNYYTVLDTDNLVDVKVGRICYNAFNRKTLYIYTINDSDEDINYDSTKVEIITTKTTITTSISLRDTKAHKTKGSDISIKKCEGDILEVNIIDGEIPVNIYTSTNDIKMFKNELYNFCIDYFVYYMAIIVMAIVSYKDMKKTKKKLLEKQKEKENTFSSNDLFSILDDMENNKPQE